MPKAIKPVGGQPDFVWSELLYLRQKYLSVPASSEMRLVRRSTFDGGLLNPTDVKPSTLPAKAGIYVVVAHDSQENVIKQWGEPAHSPLPGVVYVGMTGSSHTLKGRFAALARAWRPNSRQKKPSHGSREHYNNDPDAQKAFSVENVRIRYQPLPTSVSEESEEVRNLAAKHNLTTDELREKLRLEKTADEHVEAIEASQIQWFKRQYGYIPMLNRDDDGSKDRLPTDGFLSERFADMESRGL